MLNNDVELLAPAGSYEAMVAAIENGCNAVYLSGQMYGARAFATNFSLQELKEAVKFAHLRNVKIYVTVNTLYDNKQIQGLLSYLDYLNSINVDGLLIQDMGIVNIVKSRYPNIELHLSTQCSIHNLEGIKYFEKQGVKRIVLARENNISEIRNICKNTDIDIEVFVHGALCISCSGQCLMSSEVTARSGNKGECAQLCRLPYNLMKDNKIISYNDYLLSPKDLCSIDNIGQLIDAGVKSFKIEGRMKSPQYVAATTKAYRRAIDNYLSKLKANYDKEILVMKQMFNRDYTSGLLMNNYKDFITHTYSGNTGIQIGMITNYDNRNHQISIKLTNTLHQNDRIGFEKHDFLRTITKLYLNGKLVNQADAGDIVKIDLDRHVKKDLKVFKIIDYKLNNEIENSYKGENIHLPLNMLFSAHKGTKPSLTINYKDLQINVTHNQIMEESLKHPATYESIFKQLSKLGDTPFSLSSLETDMDNDLFIPVSLLNNIRREGIALLEEKVLSFDNKVTDEKITIKNKQHYIKHLDIKITDIRQLNNIDLSKADRIYYPFNINDKMMNDEKFVPYTNYWEDSQKLQNYKDSSKYLHSKNVLVSDFGALNTFIDKNTIINYNFNVYNDYALDYFHNEVVLSLELSKKEINKLKCDNDLTLLAYGKPRNMNLRHCIISDYYFQDKKEGCNKCKTGHYSIVDRKNERFDIITDTNCNNYVLNNKPILIKDINDYNVDRILLDFTNEDSNRINEIINEYLNIINL
ncbi:MAG: U32 family peptidase [Thomasclavelia sp.]|nr:U32 family peptidase [Thomasclavelia sp.]